MPSIGTAAEILNVRSDNVFLSANFTLVLKNASKLEQSYSFYVPPEEIDINFPARINVYQTSEGVAHIDHIGGGLATISLSGHTGFNPMVGPIGLVQYNLLRQLVARYYELCRKAVKSNTVELIISISFPDNPSFGTFPVTIKDFSLRRSVAKPLQNRYTMALIIIGDDLNKTTRATAFSDDTLNARLSLPMPEPRAVAAAESSEVDTMAPPEYIVREITTDLDSLEKLLTDYLGVNVDLASATYREVLRLVMAYNKLSNPEELEIGAKIYVPSTIPWIPSKTATYDNYGRVSGYN
jgi:hypothetical protein